MDRIIEVQNYQGLSTEDKPANPAEGATYHAVDTGDEYIFCNDAWVLDLRMSAAFRRAMI